MRLKDWLILIVVLALHLALLTGPKAFELNEMPFRRQLPYLLVNWGVLLIWIFLIRHWLRRPSS
jgi:cell shape-determining protein MreD